MDLTLRRLWSIYRSCSIGNRLHVIGREVLCPLAQVAGYVPERGRMLDIGCGHGVFVAHLVLDSPHRMVLGVDLSPAKIEAAKQASLPHDRVEFRCAAFETVDGTFDAICVVDVLYLMPPASHAALFHWCHEHLSPNGMFLLKEMGDRPRWKYWLNYAQETLSVRVLGLTLGSRLHFATPAATMTALADAGFDVTPIPVDRGYAHAHLLFVCRKRNRG